MKTAQIYHGNKAVKGSACSFWYSDNHDCVITELLKQNSWDETKKVGSFDKENKVSVKLSFLEVSAIIDCIEKNRPFSTFHRSEHAKSKSISFIPWMNTLEGKATQKGFSFSMKEMQEKNENSEPAEDFNGGVIGLTFAEARYIREFLIHCLHLSFRNNQAKEEVKETAPVTKGPTQEKKEEVVQEIEDNNVEEVAPSDTFDF